MEVTLLIHNEIWHKNKSQHSAAEERFAKMCKKIQTFQLFTDKTKLLGTANKHIHM